MCNGDAYSPRFSCDRASKQEKVGSNPGNEEAMRTLIKNGRVLDPATNTDQILDVLVEDARIKEVGEHLEVKSETVLDASGCYVMPGFIDLHVHLRDPGLTHKETVATGAAAAARGGFTTICAMPNTSPVIDSKDMVAFIHRKAADEGIVNVLQIGAVTKGQKGEELADIAGMAQAGAPAISEDGKSVMDTALYVEAMKLARDNGIKVFAHCEDKALVRGGVMHLCDRSKALGLPGISHSVEDVITARDILLAKEAGVPLHLCHVSTADSVKIIAFAKKQGLEITAEACPHHFSMSAEDIEKDDPNYKMNPPLRDPADVEAIKQGLADGTIDVIATDHAPHTMEEKGTSMMGAPFGIVGLETAASLTYTHLVDTGILTPLQMAAKLSTNGARILGSEKGRLTPGSVADLVLFDPQVEYVVDVKEFASKGVNTPFQGKTVKGKVRMTMVGGNIVYQA